MHYSALWTPDLRQVALLSVPSSSAVALDGILSAGLEWSSCWRAFFGESLLLLCDDFVERGTLRLPASKMRDFESALLFVRG